MACCEGAGGEIVACCEGERLFLLVGEGSASLVAAGSGCGGSGACILATGDTRGGVCV